MRQLIALGLVLLTGCATILQSGPDCVPVRSEPEGARVYLDGMPVGTTPMMVSINRKDEGVIEVKKDGYEPVVVDRDKVLAGWFLGNLLIGGVIGAGIDLITSNQGKYSETPVFAQLHPAGASAPLVRVPSATPERGAAPRP
jgi:hypothetical protein